MLQYITHILLDAARMGGEMDMAKEKNAQHDSLYRGGSEEALAAVAPYIFRFASNTDFASWYMSEGWGNAWGLMLKSAYPQHELHKHFRKFLLVKTEEGQELYFRFYDPRVLRIFLPTCDPAQIREFFGPIDYFLMEDEDSRIALRYTHENGILKVRQVSKADLVNALGQSSATVEKEIREVASAPATEIRNLPAAQPAVTEKAAEPSANPDKHKSKWNMFD